MTAPSPRSRPCPRRTWPTWLDAAVLSYRAPLLKLAHDEGLQGEEALDVVQEAFLALVSHHAEAPPNLRASLHHFTRNLARNRRRRHDRARPHSPDGLEHLAAGADSAEDRLRAAEDRADVARCVARLADVQRAVVTLRLLDEVPGDDVARMLGLSPGHVAVLLYRAKAALARCLTEPCEAEDSAAREGQPASG